MKRYLAPLLSLLAIAYSGYWFQVAQQWKLQVEDHIASLEDFTDSALTASYDSVQIKGYPLLPSIVIHNLKFKQTDNSLQLEHPCTAYFEGDLVYSPSLWSGYHQLSHQGPIHLQIYNDAHMLSPMHYVFNGDSKLNLKVDKERVDREIADREPLKPDLNPNLKQENDLERKGEVAIESDWPLILAALKEATLTIKNTSLNQLSAPKKELFQAELLKQTLCFSPTANTLTFKGDLELKECAIYQKSPATELLMHLAPSLDWESQLPLRVHRCESFKAVASGNIGNLAAATHDEIKDASISLTIDPVEVKSNEGSGHHQMHFSYFPAKTNDQFHFTSQGTSSFTPAYLEQIQGQIEQLLKEIIALPIEQKEFIALQSALKKNPSFFIDFFPQWHLYNPYTHHFDLLLTTAKEGQPPFHFQCNEFKFAYNQAALSLKGFVKTEPGTGEDWPWACQWQLQLNNYRELVNLCIASYNKAKLGAHLIDSQNELALFLPAISEEQIAKTLDLLRLASDQANEEGPDLTITLRLDSQGNAFIGPYSLKQFEALEKNWGKER